MSQSPWNKGPGLRLWNKHPLAWLSAFWDSSQTFFRHCCSWDTGLLLDEWTKSSWEFVPKAKTKESDMQNCQTTFDEGEPSYCSLCPFSQLGQTWKNKFSVKINTDSTVTPYVCTSVCSTWLSYSRMNVWVKGTYGCYTGQRQARGSSIYGAMAACGDVGCLEGPWKGRMDAWRAHAWVPSGLGPACIQGHLLNPLSTLLPFASSPHLRHFQWHHAWFWTSDSEYWFNPEENQHILCLFGFPRI